MNDPQNAHPDVQSYRAPHAPPLGAILEALRGQLVEAMSLPFFDGGVNTEMTPVTKHALSEAGAATIVARKLDPCYEATVALEVKSDRCAQPEVTDIGRYQVAARGHLACDDARGRTQRDVDVTVNEIDGALRLDVARLRAEFALAIQAMGTMVVE